MTRFILRRLLVTIPVLFGLIFLVFFLSRVVTHDPCRAILGEKATAEFISEWLRDPQSKYLTTNALHDVPWDDPALLQAYVNLRKPAPASAAAPAAAPA